MPSPGGSAEEVGRQPAPPLFFVGADALVPRRRAVADTLGLAPGTVKRYLSDAREKLRAVLPGLDLDDVETVSVETRDGSGR